LIIVLLAFAFLFRESTKKPEQGESPQLETPA
jgi:hypothetical protein